MATDFIAGCIGGAAGLIVGHPLDTVKVRLQAQTSECLRYKGTFHALLTITKQESIVGLYRGLSSPLYGVSLINALVFGIYGLLQPLVIGQPGNNAIWAHALAGSIAGAGQCVICSPMELVKIRMQLNESNRKQPSSFTVLRNIYKTNGLKSGVFKGWTITMYREVPGFGIYFGSYELFTHLLEKYGRLTNGDGEIGTLGMMMSGGSAGVVSWLGSFPMDVIKTRFQSDIDGRYNGIWDCAKKTYQAEGYQVFTRTLPSILIRAFPMSAVTFPIVTWILRLSHVKSDDLETSHQQIDTLLKHTRRFTDAEGLLYKNIYNLPSSYHFLTPRIPTIRCTESQNFITDIRLSKTYSKTATLCPCCSIGESSLLVPLFHGDEETLLRLTANESHQSQFDQSLSYENIKEDFDKIEINNSVLQVQKNTNEKNEVGESEKAEDESTVSFTGTLKSFLFSLFSRKRD